MSNLKQRTLDFMRQCADRWERRADDLHFIQTLLREGQVTQAEAADMLTPHIAAQRSLVDGARSAHDRQQIARNAQNGEGR